MRGRWLFNSNNVSLSTYLKGMSQNIISSGRWKLSWYLICVGDSQSWDDDNAEHDHKNMFKVFFYRRFPVFHLPTCVRMGDCISCSDKQDWAVALTTAAERGKRLIALNSWWFQVPHFIHHMYRVSLFVFLYLSNCIQLWLVFQILGVDLSLSHPVS